MNKGGENTTNAAVLTVSVKSKPGVYTQADFVRDLASFQDRSQGDG